MNAEAPPLADRDIAVLLPALRYVAQFEKAEELAGEQVVGPVTTRVLSFQRPTAAALLRAEEARAKRARKMEALLGVPEGDPVLSTSGGLDAALEVTPETAADAASAEALPGEPDEASVEQLLASMQPLDIPIGTDAQLSDSLSSGLEIEITSELLSEPPLPPILDWQAFEMQWASADVALRAFLRRELAIYYGLGAELPATLLDILALPALDSEQLRLKKLADNKWVGDFLLAVVANYGEVEPRDLQTQEVVLLLQGFRHIGLSAVADDLASELFTRASARLSVMSPQAFGTQAPRPVLFAPEEAVPAPAFE